MTDLGRRFASLDRVTVPELWGAIEQRAAAAHGSTERVTRIRTAAPAALRPSTSRSPMVVLAAAVVLLAVVLGAAVVGSGLIEQAPPTLPPDGSPLVPAPPATPSPVVSASPRATDAPAASPSPSTAADRWITGRELMDRLSAAYGYEWSRTSGGDVFLSEFDSGWIRVLGPIDEPASVELGAVVAAADELERHVDRIAEALAPDAAAWLREAMAQGLAAIDAPGLEVDTVAGGSVGIDARHDRPFPDAIEAWFSPLPLPTGWNAPNDTGLVVTVRDGLLWAVNADGTGEGPLLRGEADPRRRYAPKVAEVLGWTPDGSRLVYRDGAGDVLWTDAAGSTPVLVAHATPNGGLCPASASDDDACQAARVDDVKVSLDGRQLANPEEGDPYAVGVVDVGSGQITRIAFETRTGARACAGPFGDGPPALSPDGTRVVFGTGVRPRVGGWCQGAVFVVNVDGTGLRRLNPSSVHAMGPRWSADGSTILFNAPNPRSAWDGQGDATRIKVDTDVYSVRPDGSGLTALTHDGDAMLVPSLTRDGRTLFIRGTDPETTPELWSMGADGANKTRLDTSVPTMTAAGCLVCPDPDERLRVEPDLAYWQPLPGDHP